MATLVHEWAEEQEMSCSAAFSRLQDAQHPGQPGSVPGCTLASLASGLLK